MERNSQVFPWPAEGFFIEDLLGGRVARRPVYADRHLLVTRTDKPTGLRFAGEIDLSNSEAVADSVRVALGQAGSAHLDVANLSFCDISGIRALVAVALELGGGTRLLLHGLPEQLQTLMRVTGWSDLPSLALCECGGGE